MCMTFEAQFFVAKIILARIFAHTFVGTTAPRSFALKRGPVAGVAVDVDVWATANGATARVPFVAVLPGAAAAAAIAPWIEAVVAVVA